MRVCVNPVPKLGIAMRRVALALERTAPPIFEIVQSPVGADLQVLHAVDTHVQRHLTAPLSAVMMHCLDFVADPAGNGDNIPIPDGLTAWNEVWGSSLLVWSYYDLTKRFVFKAVSAYDTPLEQVIGDPTGPHFYYAPLGVDGRVFEKRMLTRTNGVLTTGYVSGPRAEAIEEMAIAAAAAGLTTVHLGPEQVSGMTARVRGWSSVTNITDPELSVIYSRTKYVSGLRHGEGFELPILEGLAAGCRPICFDLDCYRRWFSDHAVFVKESSGDELVGLLTDVFKKPPRAVLPGERDHILRRFDWDLIGHGFWRALMKQLAARDALPTTRETVTVDAVTKLLDQATATARRFAQVSVNDKPRVVWLGDSPSTDWTGFGRASRYILEEVRKDFDVTVIGTTYDGTPYDRALMPYEIWPLNAGVGQVVSRVRPSCVVIQHDPWQVKPFMEMVGNVPVVAALAVDGKNCDCSYLNGLAMAIFWTAFGEQEARLSGYSGPSRVIPLGVDLDIYHPAGDKRTALAQIGITPSGELVDGFIVGYICRNQPRKRLDLAIRHFSEWVKSRNVNDAFLYLQTGPTGEAAYDTASLIRYERIANRTFDIRQGYRQVHPEARLAFVYRALDLFWSTTQGEGFGLPALEAMACGTPCSLPDWSGYGSWASPAAHLVRIADVSGTLNWPGTPRSGITIGVLGAVPSLSADVEALDKIYRDHEYRAELRDKGLKLATQEQFRWPVIGRAYSEAIRDVLAGPIRMSAAE